MKFDITVGPRRRALKMVAYGPEGIGKSTLAAAMPSPLFIDCEGGTDQLDVARMPTPTSWQMLLEEVRSVRDEAAAHTFGTLVIDTVDAAERLCTEAVVGSDADKKSIEDWGYGKGYVLVKERFSELVGLLSEVVAAGVNVVLLGHAILSKVERPEEASAYDKWSMKLIDTKRVSDAALVKEWADMVLFLDYKVYVSKDDRSGKVTAAGRRRVVKTTHDATYDAKNRFGLPDEMPLDEGTYRTLAALLAPAPAATVATEEGTASFPESPAADGEEPCLLDPTAGWPDSMAPLADLMAADGVAEAELRAAVAATGNFPAECDPTAYPPEFVSYLCDHWAGVTAKVAELRKTPF